MHKDYARDIVSVLAARADSGEMVGFGWGGELRDWQRRLTEYVLTEGYGQIDGALLNVTDAGLGFHSGCACEGCAENTPHASVGYKYAAQRLLRALKEAQAGAYRRAHHCRSCGAARYGEPFIGGLCNNCVGLDDL